MSACTAPGPVDQQQAARCAASGACCGNGPLCRVLPGTRRCRSASATGSVAEVAGHDQRRPGRPEMIGVEGGDAAPGSTCADRLRLAAVHPGGPALRVEDRRAEGDGGRLGRVGLGLLDLGQPQLDVPVDVPLGERRLASPPRRTGSAPVELRRPARPGSPAARPARSRCRSRRPRSPAARRTPRRRAGGCPRRAPGRTSWPRPRGPGPRRSAGCRAPGGPRPRAARAAGRRRSPGRCPAGPGSGSGSSRRPAGPARVWGGSRSSAAVLPVDQGGPLIRAEPAAPARRRCRRR